MHRITKQEIDQDLINEIERGNINPQIKDDIERIKHDIENIKKDQMKDLMKRDLAGQDISKHTIGYLIESLKDRNKIQSMNNISLKDCMLKNEKHGYVELKPHTVEFETQNVTYYHNRKKNNVLVNSASIVGQNILTIETSQVSID